MRYLLVKVDEYRDIGKPIEQLKTLMIVPEENPLSELMKCAITKDGERDFIAIDGVKFQFIAREIDAESNCIILYMADASFTFRTYEDIKSEEDNDSKDESDGNSKGIFGLFDKLVNKILPD